MSSHGEWTDLLPGGEISYATAIIDLQSCPKEKHIKYFKLVEVYCLLQIMDLAGYLVQYDFPF